MNAKHNEHNERRDDAITTRRRPRLDDLDTRHDAKGGAINQVPLKVFQCPDDQVFATDETQALMGDGSVRSLRDSVAINTK